MPAARAPAPPSTRPHTRNVRTRSAHRACARHAVARSPLCSAVCVSLPPLPPPLAGLLPPPARQLCRRESIPFPAPRPRDEKLLHEHLARQQEAAARLAALTPLPPSPTLSQEARDEALAVSLAAAVGDHSRHPAVSHSSPGCTISRSALPSFKM